MIFGYVLAISVIFYLLIEMPLGRLTHYYDVFVAADPKTVWDTYFIHVRGSDYRPGTRLLGYETLSENPLTVRLTTKPNYLPAPVSIVTTYDLYEPYTRYKERGGVGSIEIAEKGEFVSKPGGTRLHIAITAPRRGLLLPWIARRRVERNMRALQDVCEGRQT
jgi:hypothetical protein